MWSKIGILSFLAAMVIAAAFTGPASALHEGGSGTWEVKTDWPREPELPPAKAEAVWSYIKETKRYKSWPKWPGKKKLYQGQHPHGALLTTYVTRSAKKVIKKKLGAFPAGSIIVKENYMPDKNLAAITVMYKIKGYNPEAGDWFWAKYKPDGTVEKAGKVKGCINCHQNQEGNDWVYTGKITE